MKMVLFVAMLMFVGGGLSSADLVVSVAEFQVIGYDGTDQASMLTAFTFADGGKSTFRVARAPFAGESHLEATNIN